MSKKHNIIFIKGRKVASTSVEVFLSGICGPDDIITPITPVDERSRLLNYGIGPQNYGAEKVLLDSYIKKILNVEDESISSVKPPEGLYYNHMSLKEVEKNFGAIGDKWKIIAVERNPYDKLISLANMQLRFREYKKGGLAMKSSKDEIRTQIGKIFDAGRYGQVKNIGLYKDTSDTIRAQIIRYENLIEELNSLFRELKIEPRSVLPHYKKGVSDAGISVKDVFTKEQIDLFNSEYEDEFLTFGYEML